MKEIEKTENLLEQFVRKPPPPGLRARVLSAAAVKRERSRLLSPALMLAVLVATVFAAVLFVIDAGFEGGHQKRLASLTGHQQTISQELNDFSTILREFVAGDSNASWAVWRLKSGRQAKEKESREAKKELLRRNIDEY